MLPFSEQNKIFFGYFDPENVFLDDEKNSIRGDLTVISAQTEALHGRHCGEFHSLQDWEVSQDEMLY